MPPTLAAATNTACGLCAAIQRSTSAWRAQIGVAALGDEHFAVLRGEPAHQRGADHAAVAGDPDPLARERIVPGPL